MRIQNALQSFEFVDTARGAAIESLRRQLRAMARDRRRVVLHGPSGVGKECLARYYARQAAAQGTLAADRPFLALNCACLGSVAHSELFGHVRGAFTGAVTDRRGAFEVCDGGVLFLDEIGDLPRRTQAMVLRALDERSGTGQRLGATDVYPTSGVTVIVATNRPLETLRSDLLERLGHHLVVPALVERTDEIVPALHHFAREALRTRRDVPLASWLVRSTDGAAVDDADLVELAAQLVGRLERPALASRWTGNFRALRRAVEYAVTLATMRRREGFLEEATTLFTSQCDGDGGACAEARSVATTSASAVVTPDEPEVDAALYERVVEAFDQATTKLPRAEIDGIARLVALHPERTIARAQIDAITGKSEATSRNRLKLLLDAGLLETVGNGDRYRILRVPRVSEPFRWQPRTARLVAPELGTELAERSVAWVAQLDEMLARTAGVYVAAAAGAGKTTVGQALATRLARSRPVLWWSFPKDASAAGGLSDLLAALEEELLAPGGCSPNGSALDALTERERVLRLTGFFTARRAEGHRPVLVLDDVEHIADRDGEELLLAMARHWTDCQMVLLGERRPLGFERLPPESALVEVLLAQSSQAPGAPVGRTS